MRPVDMLEMLEERGLSAAALARAAGVAKSTALGWTVGARPRNCHWPRIAEALGIDVKRLRAILAETRRRRVTR